MTRLEFWSLSFCGVASMEFHPRNSDCGSPVVERVCYAAIVADAMLTEFDKRAMVYSSLEFNELFAGSTTNGV